MAIDTKYLIGNTDAVVWAEEWCEVAREIAEDKDEREVIDEGWMIGWFAHAIIAGFDEGYARALKEDTDTKSKPLSVEQTRRLLAQPDAPVLKVVSFPSGEHLYDDQDIARLAQEVEDLYDVLGDILGTTNVCVYDEEEFCHTHYGTGRPCPFEIARSYINAK